jgi:hypothetical protein
LLVFVAIFFTIKFIKMKQKKLDDLLKKMSDQSILESEMRSILSLNDRLSELIIGGKQTGNGVCSGKNLNCTNLVCGGTTNGVCSNQACVLPDEIMF